jgi:hypothetical protein
MNQFRRPKLVTSPKFYWVMTQIFMIFYAPRVGILSLLTVSAEFMEELEADISVTLSHFSVLEGWRLLMYTVIQSSCIFLVPDPCQP